MRFIPAGAGNGECSKDARRHTTWRFIPLARNSVSTFEAANSRFIPAGAGNRLLAPVIPAESEAVHPAGAGNRRDNCPHLLRAGRFIPAGAGNWIILTMLFIEKRFIPAGAGNSPENLSPAQPGGFSSPLARGTVIGTSEGLPLRFIPAGAGNSHRTIAGTRWPGQFIPAGAGNSSIWQRLLKSVHPFAGDPRWRIFVGVHRWWISPP